MGATDVRISLNQREVLTGIYSVLNSNQRPRSSYRPYMIVNQGIRPQKSMILQS